MSTENWTIISCQRFAAFYLFI